MLRKLLAALEDVNVLMAPDEVVDALWLSHHLPQPQSVPTGKSSQSELKSLDKPFSRPPHLRRKPPEQVATELPLIKSIDEPVAQASTVPIKVYDPGMLGEPTALCHEFRLLRRWYPSRTQRTLDISQTINTWAETGRLLPLTRPCNELWLSALLVIDDTSSGFLWRRAAAELHDIVLHSGAFRHFSTLHISKDGKLESEGRQIKPRSLLDPTGRTLLLFATDAVDDFWHDGRAASLINKLPPMPAAMLQWLPKRLWETTALGRSQWRSVHSMTGVAQPIEQQNRRRQLSPVATHRPLPVVALSPDSVRRWAKALRGSTLQRVPAVILPESASPREFYRVAEPPTPEQMVMQFDGAASSDARRFLRMLVCVPLSLPIIRFLRSTLLPDAETSIIAEVVLSGLLEQVGDQDPETASFHFLPGVASVLEQQMSARDSYATLRVVAQHLDIRFGGRSFDAALKIPASEPASGDVSVDAGTQAFAMISAPILRRLGGRYEQLAESLQPSPKADLHLNVQQNTLGPIIVQPKQVEIDLLHTGVIPDDAVIETRETGRDPRFFSSKEFLEGIGSGHFGRHTRCRIQGSKKFIKIGETLIYAVERHRVIADKPSNPHGTVCRLPYINSFEAEGDRIYRLLPSKTSSLSECVIFVTRHARNGNIYAHSNFVVPGYCHSTKMYSDGDIGLIDILNCLISDDSSEVSEVDLKHAHFSTVKYILDRSTIDLKARPWLSLNDAENIQYVEELEDVKGVAVDRSHEITVLLNKQQFSEAIQTFNELQESIHDECMINTIAWVFATCKDATLRDGNRAVELANQTTSKQPNADFMDTLAAAYAAMGDFSSATHTQQRACELAPEEDKELFHSHLSQYERGEPWIEN